MDVIINIGPANMVGEQGHMARVCVEKEKCFSLDFENGYIQKRSIYI